MESAVELRAITLGAAAETDEVAAAAIQLTLFVDRHEVSLSVVAAKRTVELSADAKIIGVVCAADKKSSFPPGLTPPAAGGAVDVVACDCC